jgi:RsiW-degrading membrane proteinase PrsW (M82 family)
MAVAAAPAQGLAPRVLNAVSWAGLAFSLAVLLVSAPHLLTIGGGARVVFGNVAAFGWTLALLWLVFWRQRSVGARALAGAALGGFFGVSALAIQLGKPLVFRLGTGNDFIPLFFAPVTEELVKLLPAALFLALALRSRTWRPTVADTALIGFTAAAGFELYENILYARGGGGPFGTLPFSALLPSLTTRGEMIVGGHAIYGGLSSLALAVTILYGRRIQLARFALPAALLLLMLEHATVNRYAQYAFFDPGIPFWAHFVSFVSLHGALSSMLFIGGVAAVALLEKRVPC